MGPVSTPPIDEARSIFTNLGYTVTGDGTEFRAERKWRLVRVTAVAEPQETPTSGTLRCFVTWRRYAESLRDQLVDACPEYDWAIISVENENDYEVIRAPTTVLA